MIITEPAVFGGVIAQSADVFYTGYQETASKPNLPVAWTEPGTYNRLSTRSGLCLSFSLYLKSSSLTKSPAMESTSPGPVSAPLTAVIPTVTATSERRSEAAAAGGAKAWLPELALVGVAVIWGVNIPVMKSGLDHIDRYSFNALRLALSAVVLVLLGWNELRSGQRPRSNLRFHQVLIYAGLASIIYQYLFLLGVSRATSANAGLIVATIPMWTALAARVFLKEQLPWLGWFGLLAALTGTLIVTLSKTTIGPVQGSLAGNLFMLGAALSWACATVYSRPLMKAISPIQLSACASVIGLPFHVLIALHSLPQSLPLLSDGAVLYPLVYSGVFSTGLALAMWNYGVRHAGAAQAAIFQNLIPAIAIFTAWLFRGEQITLPQITGGTMIIIGLLIMRRSRN